MEKLPIYPVETFPDRPAFIVPAIGEAYDAGDVARAIADEGYRIRQDLEPIATDTPGAEGWYVFVEGQEEHLGSALGAAKKKKGASKKDKALARKSAKGGARRRKRGANPSVKAFKAKGFNLKKMPLGIATQLIFAQIWPDAYKVSQDFPRVEFDPSDAPWLRDMDFNPHLYMNVEQAMEWSREGQADPTWKEWAAECAGTGEPPYFGLFLYAEENHQHGKSIERQIMEVFDFPFEAQALLVRYERDRSDDEAYSLLWEEYLTPYFMHLAYVLDLMKTPEMTGYFNFTMQPQSEEWGLFYEECSSDERDDYGQHAPGESPMLNPDDDDDEENMDEPEPAEEPEGGDLNEP